MNSQEWPTRPDRGILRTLERGQLLQQGKATQRRVCAQGSDDDAARGVDPS